MFKSWLLVELQCASSLTGPHRVSVSIVCEEDSVLLLRQLPAGVTYTIRWLGSCIGLIMRAICCLCTVRPPVGLARCLQLMS